jgi:CubicO group peptidase (beta-lactamase class C family)
VDKKQPFVGLALILLLVSCGHPAATATPVPTAALASLPASVSATELDADVLAGFEDELEGLRQLLKIPGFSAAIVHDQQLVWAKGFGYADLENSIAATPNTPYRLASVTKPIAATLIMQLVEEGMLDLDDPVSEYGVELESDGVIQVWHLLTHTSEGVPGTRHNYDGNRYAMLGTVIEAATGRSFAELLSERILEPLNMTNTAPNYPACVVQELIDAPEISARDRGAARINAELAKPYQLDPSYNIVAGMYPTGFNPAAGLISTVVDLAKFDIALDQGILLGEGAKEQMFEPAFSTYANRTDLMYGLGWYSQLYNGTRLLWHSGRQPPSVSALYLKVPDQNITFIILANTTNLTTPFPLGDGDVLYSALAQTFYRDFVFPRQYAKSVPQIDWETGERDLANRLKQVTDEDVRALLERELWSHRQLLASVGRADLVDRLRDVHRQVYGASRAGQLDSYAVNGVDYTPIVQAQVELDEATLEPFTGNYILSEAPAIEGASLPKEVRIELKHGQLFGVEPEVGCISLVPVAPTRFAIPENPGLVLAFHLNGDSVEKLTVEAGGIAAVYTPSE